MCLAGLQQNVADLKAEQQAHQVQIDTLKRENTRLKEAQAQVPPADTGAHLLVQPFRSSPEPAVA